MLREELKQEIDNLSEEELVKLANFFTLVKLRPGDKQKNIDLKQQIYHNERAEEFKNLLPAAGTKVSHGLGEAMPGIETSKLDESELMQTRGW